MRLARLLPRCTATTAKGNPCRALEAVPGKRLCKYHDLDLKPATVARNTAALRAYWQRKRAEKLAGSSNAETATVGTPKTKAA
jgi:hypothetical protein